MLRNRLSPACGGHTGGCVAVRCSFRCSCSIFCKDVANRRLCKSDRQHQNGKSAGGEHSRRRRASLHLPRHPHLLSADSAAQRISGSTARSFWHSSNFTRGRAFGSCPAGELSNACSAVISSVLVFCQYLKHNVTTMPR